MKHLLAALLLASFSFSSALADSPEAILKDYRKQATQAVERLNQSLEKAATPIITKLVKDGDTDGAELLTSQLKVKLTGGSVTAPQASAVQLFSLYDEARAKALAPIQKSGIARIDSLLKTAGGPKLQTVTELGKARAEIETGIPSSVADNGANVPKTSAGVTKKVAELVKSLGGEYIESSDGNEIKFTRATLSTPDLLQMGADKNLKTFLWNTGKGLTDEGLAAFEGMKNLQELFLWSTGKITDEGLKHLAGCEKLRSVTIGANGDSITGTGFEALAHCTRLESLTLNFLYGVQGPNLRHLSKLKSLDHLSLSMCKNVTDADLDWVAQMTSLTYLNLGHTGVTDAGLHKLQPLKRLTELEVTEPLVTQNGVQGLTKALRKLKVTFLK